MRQLFTLALIAALFSTFVTSCSKEKNLTPASSHNRLMDVPAIDVVVNEISTSSFTDVVNDANVNVVVVPDTQYSVIMEAPDYMTLNDFTATVESGTLTISQQSSTSSVSSTAIVYVHTPVVSSVTLGKKGVVTTEGNYAQLTVDMKGSGTVVLSGNAQHLNIISSGSGTVDALSMPAIDVVVNSKGGGTTKVAAQNTLNVDLRGNSTVYYSGSPSITQSLKGNSQLIHL